MNCLLRDDLPTLCFLATSEIERTVPALNSASAASIDPVVAEKSRVEESVSRLRQLCMKCVCARSVEHLYVLGTSRRRSRCPTYVGPQQSNVRAICQAFRRAE